MKAVPDVESWYEIWYNRDLGPGVGRHQRAITEETAIATAKQFKEEGHPNIEVLAVKTVRTPVEW